MGIGAQRVKFLGIYRLWCGLFLLGLTACSITSSPAAATTGKDPLADPDALAQDPLVAGMLARVTSNQLSSFVGDLSGEWPVLISGETHTLSSRVHLAGDPVAKATEYVYERLQDMGLDAQYVDWQLPTGQITRGRNVVAELRGLVHPGEIVLLTAHVDDMVNRDVTPAGVRLPALPGPVIDPLWHRLPAPGADDNASGTAGVLLAARILQGYRFERTVRFVFFTGEENGYLGSYCYATAMRDAGENLVAVYNLDMLAYDHADGPVVDVNLRAEDTSPLDTPLARVFLQVIRAYQIDLIPELHYQTGIHVGSDHGSFWWRGYPAVHFMEDGDGDFNPYYHSQYETLDNLNMIYFTHIIQAVVGTVAHAAGPLPQD